MKPEETDIFTAISEWFKFSKQFAKSTKDLHRYVIFGLVKWLPEGIETIGQLKYEFVEKYIEQLKAKDKHTKMTILKYKCYLRRFYRWLQEQYDIEIIVPDAWPKPKPVKIPVVKAPDGTNVVAEWLEYCRRHTKDTQQGYRAKITHFIEHSGIKTIEQINCKLIEQYVSSLLGEGKTNATANRYFIIIKSFCRWLARNYNVPNCTKEIKRLSENPTEPRVLTWEEYQKILSVAEGHKADIAKMLANTGVRVSELIGLKWGSVSKDFKMLTVIGKGRKKRYIPLNDVCREVLQNYRRGSDDEHLDFVGHRQNRKTIYRICEGLAKKAGIPRAGPHAYRHLFATELLRRGVPISHVSKLLGHSSIAITEKAYIHFMPNFLNGLTDVLAENN